MEVLRLGITDQSTVLQKSQNPIDPHTFMYAVDGNVAYADTTSDAHYPTYEEDPEEPTLPDWLEVAEVVQTEGSVSLTLSSISIVTTTPTVPGSTFPVGFSPLMASPAVPLDHSRMFTITTLPVEVSNKCSPTMSVPKATDGKINHPQAPKSFAAQTPMLTSLLGRSSHLNQDPIPSVYGFNTTLSLPQYTSFDGIPVAPAIHPVVTSGSALSTTTTLSMPTIESLLATPKVSATIQTPSIATSKVCTNVTPVNVTVGSTLDQTAVQDEAVVVFDGRLDTSIPRDPLYLEGINANTNSIKSTLERKTQTSTEMEKVSKGDKILRSILRAIENNGKELRNVQRNVNSVVDEIRAIKRTIVSLERTTTRKNKPTPPPRRSVTSLFRSPHNKKGDQPSRGSKVKSSVKRV